MLQHLPQQARRALLAESRKHAITAKLRQIPSLGPIRPGGGGGADPDPASFPHQATALGLQRTRFGNPHQCEIPVCKRPTGPNARSPEMGPEGRTQRPPAEQLVFTASAAPLRALTSRHKFPLNSPLTHHLSNLDSISPVAHSKYGSKI